MQPILPITKGKNPGIFLKVMLLRTFMFVITLLMANLLLVQKGFAQTTIAAQNFDAINTMTVAVSGGTAQTGNSGSGDRPQSAAFFTSSTTARRVTNTTSTLTFGNVSGLSANAAKFFEFRLAAWSIGTTSNGVDAGDDVKVEVSLDGGTVWSSEILITGASGNNAYWHYTTGTGIASVIYDGNNSPSNFAPGGSGNRTTDGYSTVRVSLPVSATQARLRITMDNNSTSEAYTVDDVKLATPAYAAQFISMSTGATSWCKTETRNVTVTVKNVGTTSWTTAGSGMNIGLKWDEDADYGGAPTGIPRQSVVAGVPSGDVATGTTVTYTFPNVPSSQVTGTNHLTFDVVKEGDCWFGNNNVSCGPGNSVFTSANQTIVAAPTANAGTAVNTCSNIASANITAGSSASNQASVLWSTPNGTGTFANATSLTTATYTPSAADITAGSVTLTLTAIGNTPCGNATSNKTLTINPAPTAVAGTVVATCSTSGAVNITAGSSASNNASVTWSTTNGTGTFANANSLTTATYTPSAADITAGTRNLVLTAVGLAGCANATNNKAINITSAPAANAGTAINTCSNTGAVNITTGSTSTNNSGITWSTPNGTGTFANANSLTTATYTPSAADIVAGSVTITLTATPNAPCASSATANKTLTINTLPTAVAGTAVLTCSNSGAVNITAGSSAANQQSITWTTTNGTGSFTNSTSLTTATYNPSAADITAGSRTLRLTAVGKAGCSNVTDDKLINITQAPSAAAGTAIVTCANSGAVSITAGSSASNNAGVTWSSSGTGTFANANSLTTATYDPSAADILAGSVTLTLTATGNSPCGNATSNKTFTINAIPTTTGITICQGTASGSLTSNYTCPSGAPVTAGANLPGTGASVTGIGNVAWTNPTNVLTNNNVYATATLANASAVSNYLRATNYSFAIPATATITGIQVAISRFSTNVAGNVRIRDNEVRLVKANAVIGTNKFNSGVDWPSAEATFTYGGTTDLWGTTWTPADINNVNFGAALSILNATGAAQSYTASVDYIQVTVTYTVPGSLNWYTVSSGGTAIGSGSPFNPVGVLNSGLPNTNTAGTTIFYAECATLTGCRTPTNYVITAAPAAPVSGGDQTVCSDGNPNQTLTATATGGTITWYNAATNGIIVTPAQVGVGTSTYYAQAFDGTCNSLTRTAVSLTILAPPVAAGSNQTVCEDGNPTQTLTATATGGTITWYDAAVGGNVVSSPVQVGVGTSTYYAEAFDGTCTSLSRAAITLTINPAPAAPVSGGNQTVCENGNPTQTLTATATGGTITWYDAAVGGNIVTPTQVGVGTSTYYAEASDGTCPSLTRTAVTLTITAAPVAPTSGGNQTVCEDGNPTQTLTATATSAFIITWYDAAVGGNIVTAPEQVGVGTVTYYAESFDGTCNSVTRTAVTLTINAAPAAPTASNQTACEDGNPNQTLTATATGGTITWYDAATGGNVVATPTQVGVGTVTYYAEAFDGTCSSLTRTAVSLTIYAAPAAPISGGDQTVCEDGNPGQTLTATATGITIIWFDAAIGGNVVANPTQVGVGTVTYYAENFDGTCSSLTRTAVSLTITAAPVPVASNQTVCSDGTLTQTLTASATGGTITWYDAAVAGNVVANPTQVGVGTSTYYAEAFDGVCTSLTRAQVVLTINPVPDAPTSGGDQTVCEDGNPNQALTATATGGTITWYDAATNGNVVTPTQVGVGTTTYYAEASDGTCSSLARTAVTLTILAAPAAPTASNQTACEDGNPNQTLTATATGGTITWYDAATGGNVVSTPTQVGVGTVTYYAESFDGTCTSLTRTAVSLTIYAAPAAPTASNQTACEDGNPTQTLTATATGGTIIWFDAAVGGNVVTTPTQVGVGTVTYYAESFDGTCSSLTRTAVTLAINAAPSAPTASNQTACEDGNPTQTLTATATGGTITWYDAATGGNVVANPTQVGVGTITYYAESSDGTCSSLTRTAVALTINAAPSAPTASNQAACEDGNPTQTLTATATGGTITWYDASTGGNVVANPTQVGVGTVTYYAESSDGTCSSLTRTAVTLTINAAPSAPTASNQTACEDGNPTQTLTATATGGTITWYDAATGGNVVTNPIQVGAGTVTYYAESSDGTCSSLTRTAVTLTINAAPAAPTASNQTACEDGNPTQTLTATATGGTITWYDASTGGNVVANPIQVGVGTVTYYAESSDGTCSSLTRTAVTLTINPAAAAPISGGDQTVCSDGNPTQTLTATATGGTITWYDAAVGGNIVAPTQVGVGTVTYYAESSDGTCSSLTRAAVTLTINPLPATAGVTVTQPNCATATGTITVDSPLGVGFEYSIGLGYQSSPVFSGLAPNSYNIFVKNNFGCISLVPANATVNPQPFVPGAPVVTGITNICPYLGTSEQVEYTASIPGATSYNWVLPPNVTLQSGAGTGTIWVTFASGFGAQANKQIRVSAVSACGTSAQTIYYLVAQFPSTPGVITGPTNICALIGTANTATYTINKVTAATNYVWTTGTGTSVTHPNGPGANDTVIVVTYASNYASSSITVAAVNGCGTSGSVRSLLVPRTSASTPGLINGPTNVCANILPGGSAAIYKVLAISGATSYTWNAPPGSVVTHPNGPGATDTTITVQFPAGFNNGSISVSATNGCGTSGLRTLAVTKLNPATPSVIDVIQLQACPSRQYSYTISALPANATSVQWTVPTAHGAVIVNQTATSITVSYPPTAVNGSVTVQSFNSCGSSTVRTTAVKLPACPPEEPRGIAGNQLKGGTQPTTLVAAEGLDVNIYPNPTVTDFNIKVITAGKEQVHVRILDMQGRLFKTLTVMPYQTTKAGAELKAGSYLVEVRQGNVVKTIKVIKF